MIAAGSGDDGLFGPGGWFEALRTATRGTGGGLAASPTAVAAASEVGTSFGQALTEAAPEFAPGFERAADAVVSWSWAAIALGVALSLGAVGFIVWNLRKAVA